jgi:guanyl-specific ribonuclease Sa
MKHIYGMLISPASLACAMLNTALAAEPNRQADAAHRSSKDPIPASALPAQATFERIANETGGTYVFKPDGSVEDYRDNFQKILNSMTEENKRGEGQ